MLRIEIQKDDDINRLKDIMERNELVSNNATSSAIDIETENTGPVNSDSNSEEMSAWEKRLEGLE